MPLFNHGDFTLHSGARSSLLIDCEALTDADLKALAAQAALLLPDFGQVHGIPQGGVRFAAALASFASAASGRVLIADDVCTTGRSLWQLYSPGVIGVVIFGRGPCPFWVTPLLRMPGA